MLKPRPMNGNTEDITIISNGVKIEGKVTSTGSIRVDGTLKGDLNAKGNVTVGEQGNINGEITANIVTIGGRAVGTVNAKEKLVLETKCVLNGDIITKVLVIEAGAKFDGKSNMGDVREVSSPSISTKIKDDDKTG
ncbi:MAG: polymer-forming cytoskeletal protein [Ignavibacteriaceae bacterium]|jgi:cytoskeletal protein CcmA (bactofilin family)